MDQVVTFVWDISYSSRHEVHFDAALRILKIILRDHASKCREKACGYSVLVVGGERDLLCDACPDVERVLALLDEVSPSSGASNALDAVLQAADACAVANRVILVTDCRYFELARAKEVVARFQDRLLRLDFLVVDCHGGSGRDCRKSQNERLLVEIAAKVPHSALHCQHISGLCWEAGRVLTKALGVCPSCSSRVGGAAGPSGEEAQAFVQDVFRLIKSLGGTLHALLSAAEATESRLEAIRAHTQAVVLSRQLVQDVAALLEMINNLKVSHALTDFPAMHAEVDAVVESATDGTAAKLEELNKISRSLAALERQLEGSPPP